MFTLPRYRRFVSRTVLTFFAYTVVVFVNNKKRYIRKATNQDRYFKVIRPLLCVAYDSTYLLRFHVPVLECTKNHGIVICDISSNESP